jgi:hypothetical protein
MTALSPLADACPSCPPGDHPPVAPLRDPVLDGGSLKARYRHEACGFEWSCWWDPAAVEWPLLREGGQAA